MNPIRRFLRCSPSEKLLVAQAALLVVAIRLALWTVPFRVVRSRAAQLVVGASTRPDRSRIVWAVSGVSRFVPRASCLTQALAAEILLRSNGYPASIQIGVSKGSTGQLEAHAWVESQGSVLIGNHKLERFTSLK